MAENDIDYFIEKVRHSAMKISTFDVVRENAVRETRRPDGWSHGSFSQVRHEDNLTQLQRGQYTGTVTSQMCKDLASRIDATGLNVDLSKPVHISNCRGATPPLLNHCLHAIDAQV